VLTGNQATGTSPEGVGGGISIYETSMTSLLNTTVSGNTASTDGGGVDIDQGTCSPAPCAFLHMDSASKVEGNTPDDIVPPQVEALRWRGS